MKCAYPQLNKQRVEYPCGQCTNCRINKRRSWVLRNFLELHDHPFGSSFLTLTYADKHLPDRKLLDHRDVQLFIKKVRNHFGPMRYFGCGEYGSKTQRPHYHMIAYSLPETWRGSPQHDKLIKLWGKGHVDVGSVTLDSIQYVAGYTLKAGQPKDWCYVVPPYSFMSRMPGIGRNALEALIPKIDNPDFNLGPGGLSTLRVGGKKLPTDRYIRDYFTSMSYYFNKGHQDKWEQELSDVLKLEIERKVEARNKIRERTLANERSL